MAGCEKHGRTDMEEWLTDTDYRKKNMDGEHTWLNGYLRKHL